MLLKRQIAIECHKRVELNSGRAFQTGCCGFTVGLRLTLTGALDYVMLTIPDCRLLEANGRVRIWAAAVKSVRFN